MIYTYYDNIPKYVPILKYLDGPDQFSPIGQIIAVNTLNADILAVEHFLLPGTLIVVDGGTENSRFLITNLQKNWS